MARVLAAMTDQHIGRALELVHNALGDPWTADSLATAIGMSRSRFAERFTELLGQPPMTYVSEWRLQKAMTRLSASDVNVKEVAAEAGYQSAAAFTRAFSQKFGAPPSEFRTSDA